MSPRPLKIAVVGAGPVGLALALLAARRLPRSEITVFDAREAQRDVSGDPRTLALSLGSVQLLQQLKVWPADQAQAISTVHVSQAPPTMQLGGHQAEVLIRASEEGVPQLGAVLRYGQIVAPLQQAWAAVCAQHPQRHAMRFGCPVAALKPVADGVEVDAGVVQQFDLAVVAEGGVFADQARKAISRDYQQHAWVGTATLMPPESGPGSEPGSAFERFTADGPVALLPLAQPAGQPSGQRQASLVWCVPSQDDPVAALTPAQREVVLAQRLPPQAGRLCGLSDLKRFALGLNAEASLVQGRQVRIGNAAQTLHPVAGQGLNLGLRDAHALVDSLRRQDDLDAALRQVAWSRAPDRWTMIATTDFLARSFTWGWPGMGAARGLGLAALQALPGLKSVLARQMMFGRR